MMGLEQEKESINFSLFDTQYSIIPTFHESIGPISQLGCSSWGKAPEFKYYQ